MSPPELAPLDVAGRLGRLRAALAATDLDALLVTRLTDVRYLTGFTGSAGSVLVSADDAVLFTDGRYAEQAAAQVEAAGVGARIVTGVDAAAQRAAFVHAAGPFRRIGLDAQSVTWSRQRELVEWLPEAELVPAEGLVEALRRVKDAGEVDRIRAACAIADAAFARVVERLANGTTERAFALALEVEMRERGAERVSFDPIVASGPNASRPHARPSSRVVGRGELVVCDFGCVVDGYCSDMTRTVSVGDPGAEATRLFEVVLAAQAAGRAAVAAGAVASDVDRAARSVIEEAGWGEAFVHSTGHGVGLDIHEPPWVRSTTGATLLAGDVVTVEPGVYLPGVGGVRIEDTLAITATGVEPLTLTPKDLVL